MKSTKIPENIQRQLKSTVERYPLLENIVRDLAGHRGTVLLVGGAVRDLFLGLPIKDVDIEVHGLTIEALERVLKTFGRVDTVGKAFGVLRLKNLAIDWSVPRTDAAGRKPTVTLDPSMGIQQASARRDLTMNAMSINLATDEFYDPFNGLQDMRDNILRVPDPVLFVEDPLRFFRVMQFAARFEMEPDDCLNRLCASMDISGVSRERIQTEFEKLFLKARKPSWALAWLHRIQRLHDVLPEIAALRGVEQNPAWHPEGDVFEHTKQAIDAAALLDYADDKEKLTIMLAVLCHDLGKAVTSKVIDGKIRSHGHAQAGEKLAKKLLRRIIVGNKDLVTAVAKLVLYHMAPLEFVQQGAHVAAYKRLAKKLSPDVNLAMLANVAIADKRGRNPQVGNPLTGPVGGLNEFIEKANKAQVLYHEEKPLLQGRDLLDVVAPGKQIGELLRKAYVMQINEGIADKEELKRRVLALAAKN